MADTQHLFLYPFSTSGALSIAVLKPVSLELQLLPGSLRDTSFSAFVLVTLEKCPYEKEWPLFKPCIQFWGLTSSFHLIFRTKVYKIAV